MFLFKHFYIICNDFIYIDETTTIHRSQASYRRSHQIDNLYTANDYILFWGSSRQS